MFQHLIQFFRRREARNFSEAATAWHEACQFVSKTCQDVLTDERVGRTEIGVVIDQADRKLFHVRDHLSSLHGPLRRRSPTLAQRVDKATEQVFTLRNQTASFMIRSQGPTPLYISTSAEAEEIDMVHYFRAMEEAGFEARRIARELSGEIQSIWSEIQPLIAEAERTE